MKTKEELNKLFDTITANECREMTRERFLQAANEIQLDALESAQEECEKLEAMRPPYSYEPSPADCAAAIRNLKSEVI